MSKVDGKIHDMTYMESDDEKIKKEIIIYLDWLDGRKGYEPKGVFGIKDMINWIKDKKKVNQTSEQLNTLLAEPYADLKFHHEKLSERYKSLNNQ